MIVIFISLLNLFSSLVLINFLEGVNKIMDLEFHHIGIPVDRSRIINDARYSHLFKMYTQDAKNNLGIHIQYHAFDNGSPLDDKIKTQIHIAFKTQNIEKLLEGKQIIMPLYEPFKGYRCAMIIENDLLIEFIETNLSEDDIWCNNDVLENGILYGNHS